MPKNKKSNAVVFSDVQQVAALRKLIYGNKACEEMSWADTLVRCSRAGRAEADRASGVSPEQAAAYRRALQPELDRVVDALCTAAYKGNPAPFERLSKCIAWAKDSGRHTDSAAWSSDLAQCMLAYAGGRGARINMSKFGDVRSAQKGKVEDLKTLYRCARELGLILTAGSPRGKREKR